MEQNINVKKDVTRTIRKVMFPMGIITAVLGFIWFIIHTSGTTSTDTAYIKNMIEAGRYIAMPFAFLSLALAALMIAHAIMQLTRINKNNIKWEITSGIINAIVGILMFAFFIVIISNVFSVEKWSYIYYGEEGLVTGKKIITIFTFMGILTTLALFTAVFGHQFNKASLNGRNTNVKMIRTLSVFVFVMALCNILAAALTVSGGFINLEKVGEEEFAEKAALYSTAAYSAKFALAAIGTMAFAILALIPLTILGVHDKEVAKKNTIIWSVIGAVAFILFVVGAAMMTVKSVEGFQYPKKWEDDHTSASVMVLLSELACLAGGITAFIKTKVSAPKAVA